MAGSNYPIRESFAAAGDLSASQHCLMKLSAANTVDVCGSTDRPVGVLLNKPAAAGRPAEVARLAGIGQVKVNGNSPNIAAGDLLKPGNSGVLVKSTPSDKDLVCAQANEAATADGVFIEVVLFGPSWMGV